MLIYRIRVLRFALILFRKKLYPRLPFFFRLLVLYITRAVSARFFQLYGNSVFPVTPKGGTFFQKMVFGQNQNEGYFCNYYREKNVPNFILNDYDFLNFKTEIVYAKKVDGGDRHCLTTKKSCLLPICIVNRKFTNEQDNKFSVEFKVEDQSHILRNLSQNRYHFLPVSGARSVQISSSYDFLVGRPIPTAANQSCERKLVLNIFIDGLAAEIFRNHEVQKLMPNCFKFFGESFITTNCNTNCDWTDPTVPSIFSGLYSINHRVFDETSPLIGDGYKIMSEYFQESGYTTFQVCSNYGKTPSGGYVKGFDRTIYQRSMGVETATTTLLEHLRAFDQASNFIWMSVLDLHHFLDIVPAIGVQSKLNPEFHDFKDVKTKAVVGAFNPKRTMRFMKELQKVDFYLGLIFDYLLSRYKSEEFTVCLCSDHGQPYINKETELLSRQRTTVPLMIRDSSLRTGLVKERVDNIDILPSILSLVGIKYNASKVDGMVPKILGGKATRTSSFSESIFHGKPYSVAVVDDTHRFYFQARNRVDKDGFFEIERYDCYLLNSETGKDETSLNEEKVLAYTDMVFNHVKQSKYASKYSKKFNHDKFK